MNLLWCKFTQSFCKLNHLINVRHFPWCTVMVYLMQRVSKFASTYLYRNEPNLLRYFWINLLTFCKLNHLINVRHFPWCTEMVYLAPRVSKFAPTFVYWVEPNQLLYLWINLLTLFVSKTISEQHKIIFLSMKQGISHECLSKFIQKSFIGSAPGMSPMRLFWRKSAEIR
jgi:hypothetical protein